MKLKNVFCFKFLNYIEAVTSSILFTSVFGGDALTKDMVLHWREGQNVSELCL